MLHIEWDPLVTLEETGGSPILSYNVQHDQGMDSWISVFGVTTYHTQPSAFITDGIVAGTEYKIRIRALNIYGWGSTTQAPYFSVGASGIP